MQENNGEKDMNLKYYLRGLGSGIIIATTVISITYAITNRDSAIIQKAKELGMVFAEDTKENNEQSSSDKQTDEQTSSKDESVTNDKEEDTEKDTTKKSDETTTEETTTETPSTKAPEATTPTTETADTPPSEDTTTVASKYTITIKRGMSSESVAIIFKNHGVIDDIEAFNDYLVKNGYASRIRVGVYEVTRGASYKELAKIITQS